mgnify:CR=1 FL=1
MVSESLDTRGFSQARKRFGTWISRSVLQSPARVSILGFASLISVGTFLLMLPEASTQHGIGLINALFTSTSACCVTGLVIVDTGKAFTPFGQGVLLVLIQVGGLGIMTMSTLFLVVLRGRASLAGRTVIHETYSHGREGSLSSILRDVLLFAFAIEAVGVILMFFRFLPARGGLDALYISVFHSVSAFCNAGFSLFSSSFMGYREDWLLNLTLCFLIMAGGIGFPVLSELKGQSPFKKRTWSRLSLHSKLVLSTTAILLVCGSVLILVMEWRNTLSTLSVPGRFLAAFFQSVTARTAGFNTLPTGNLANETLLVLMLLMFIGASPGSCGGGVKTTTLACLSMLGFCRLRGQERPQAFRRTFSEASVGKAVSVVLIGTLVIIIATLAILMTEVGGVSHLQSQGKFLELLFEVFSAFGTVGLTTGVTGGLSAGGKLVITMVMFVGRLGPLVIAIAVTRRSISRYHYAEENILIG